MDESEDQLVPGIYEVRLRLQTFTVVVLDAQPSREPVQGFSLVNYQQLHSKTMHLLEAVSLEDARRLKVAVAALAGRSPDLRN